MAWASNWGKMSSSDVTDADDRDLNSDVADDCTDQDETEKRNCYQPACEGTIHFHQTCLFWTYLDSSFYDKLGAIPKIIDKNKLSLVIYNFFNYKLLAVVPGVAWDFGITNI